MYSRSLKAFAIGDQARDAVANTEQLEARRLHLRELLPAGKGGLPPRDTPLRPVTTGIGETTRY